MALSENPSGERERKKPGRKERMLAGVMAAIGAISGCVSAGCEPLVVAHGRSTTPDTYIKARRECAHLGRGPEGDYAQENCEMRVIDREKRR